MKLKFLSTATTERDISMSEGRVRANVAYTRLFELATSRQYWKKKVVLFKKYYNGSLQENVIKRPEACPLLYKLQYNLFILSFVYAIIK